LSNRNADVKTRRKRMRVEENSGVQRKERTREGCGEDGTGKGCGDGPAVDEIQSFFPGTWMI
jgi:hypothetical protein